MSVVLCCLRSHFVKHLPYIKHKNLSHHPIGFSLLSSSSAALCETRQQQWWTLFKSFNNTASAAAFSTSSSYSNTPPTDSFTSPYLSVRIFCPTRVSDMLSEALLCFGANSTSMDEPDNYEDHDETCISSIFSVNQDVKDCISHAADSIGLKEIPSYEVVMHNHCDWIKETQESFHPIEVTKGLWIVPEWRTPPDIQATNIILNPGLAFGTGEHPTTKLCLLLLHGLIKGGESFLDYGTGSGILAIAALKFGATLSVGFDVDPQAITSAQYNAALNNIGSEKLQLHLVPSKTSPTEELSNEGDWQSFSSTGVTAETEKYDVVIANILLNPLLDLANQIVSYAKPGAFVGVSGIISEQVPCIIERYSPFLEGISVSKMDDWACVSGSKKSNYTSDGTRT